MPRTERDVDAGALEETTSGSDGAAAIGSLLELPTRLERATAGGIDGVLVGVLVGFDAQQCPLVTYEGQPGTAALCAPAVSPLDSEHVGEQVLLAFERGDPARPFVVGRLGGGPGSRRQPPAVQVDVEADGERLTVTAGSQLVLRCGKASITLTAAGKVLIEGAYVSSRSSGALRLKGGSIQLN